MHLFVYPSLSACNFAAMLQETEQQPLSLHNFENIFREHYTSLFRYVKSVVKDEALAKDVLSDMFLHMWLQRESLRIQNIKAYLFKAARNGAIKAVTGKGNEKLSADYWDITEDAFGPFERLVAKESIKIVEQLINRLPAFRKEIIHLRLTGLKNHEIARIMDVTEKKVEYHMREAIEQLSYFMRMENYDRATIAGGMLLLNVMFTFF